MSKHPGSMRDAKKHLVEAVAASIQAKKIIGFFTKEGRLLLDEKDLHTLQELALIASSNVATIESHLGTYGRMGFGNRRFAVVKQ